MVQTICLNMIVKNESHIIIQTLTNILLHLPIDYWVISDTGSTDNTKELITEFFKERNIQGFIIEHEWRDFGYNRTKALEAAFFKTDYLFIFDADDGIFGDFILPKVLDKDQYDLKFGNGFGFSYSRPLLINNHKLWEFKCVLHEYLSCKEPNPSHELIDGDYYVESGKTGARSQNPNKYLDDANVLKSAFFVEEPKPDGGMSARYAFYCAQSFKDAGVTYYKDSINWYIKCLSLNGWIQEKYYACLEIGELYKCQTDMHNAEKYWCKSVEYDIDRIECIVHLMDYYRNNGMHILVNSLYHRFKNYSHDLRDKLFINMNTYNAYELEYNNSISAFYVNDHESGYKCCKTILLNSKNVNIDFVNLTIKNFMFYIDIASTDNNITDLLDFCRRQLQKDENVLHLSAFQTPNATLPVNPFPPSLSASEMEKGLNDKIDGINLLDLLKLHNILVKNTSLPLLNIPNNVESDSPICKIVNLKRRPDRKQNTLDLLHKHNVSNIEWIDAVDGNDIQPTPVLRDLFIGNDFNYRRGVIGCALSHYNLWMQLLLDSTTDYYIILEDDLSDININFNQKLIDFAQEFKTKDFIFLGYHMFHDNREANKHIYDNTNETTICIEPLNKSLCVGGTFGYSINKHGAQILIDYANKNGICYAIDAFIYRNTELQLYECKPHVLFSDWNENIMGDSDIQQNYDNLQFD
jgi:GR25 family glycosyltransferase involved in LPS biosynthesis